PPRKGDEQHLHQPGPVRAAGGGLPGGVGPQGLRETAELCTRKAHYACEQLTRIHGVSLRFARPFFKEFVLQVPGDAEGLLARLLESGYHAGLALGRWYPALADCISVAVTEKRTR